MLRVARGHVLRVRSSAGPSVRWWDLGEVGPRGRSSGHQGVPLKGTEDPLFPSPFCLLVERGLAVLPRLLPAVTCSLDPGLAAGPTATPPSKTPGCPPDHSCCGRRVDGNDKDPRHLAEASH